METTKKEVVYKSFTQKDFDMIVKLFGGHMTMVEFCAPLNKLYKVK